MCVCLCVCVCVCTFVVFSSSDEGCYRIRPGNSSQQRWPWNEEGGFFSLVPSVLWFYVRNFLYVLSAVFSFFQASFTESVLFCRPISYLLFALKKCPSRQSNLIEYCFIQLMQSWLQQVWPDPIWFYVVLPASNWVLLWLTFKRFSILRGHLVLNWISLNELGNVLGLDELDSVWQNFIRFCRVLLGFNRFNWI